MPKFVNPQPTVIVGKGGAALSDNDNFYVAVPDGGKIFIATPVEVEG